MRRLWIVLCALLVCAWLSPGRGGPLGAAPAAAQAGEQWPSLSRANRWMMVEAEPLMDRIGGGDQVVALCRRGRRVGYNGLLLWDSNLWERELPAAYMENARVLKAGLRELGFTLVVQMCPRGQSVARWSGDWSMVEPRPIDPHPEEKDYRYLCLAHPGVIPVWEEQIRRAEEIYHPMGWLLQYDEIRVAGTDARCRATGRTPGSLLRDHVQRAVAMVRRVTPGRLVAVWSDMFDPYFNATTRRYYHVNGSLAAAAGAVDRDVLILSWNDKPESFPYWSSRGNRQIVPLYFDHDDMTPAQERSLIQTAVRYPGVVGWMYATWRRQYFELEAYGQSYNPLFTAAAARANVGLRR
jgi:hypothetical protein